MTDVQFGRKRPRLTITRNRQQRTPGTIKRWLIGVVLILAVSPLLGLVYTYTRGGESARVHAATASTLNFQARLQNASGSLVADGNYSIQFKLYDAVSGGTNEWTETETVTVKNGYLSANLGSVTPFASTIDWSQEKWLTMNINSDGEMNPRIKLTGVPFAFRAGLADKLSITGGTLLGDDILQKAPGSVQSVSSTNSGLRLNQTGSGGLVQLQGNGLDVFTVDKTGNTVSSGSLTIGAGLTLGNSTSTNAGTIRWSGTDFEGYDGFSWISLTTGSGLTGTNPIINKVKTADETVNNSATLQDDDQLFFNVGANETWTFRYVVQANSGTTPDFKFAVTAPAGATCKVSYSDPEGATSVANLGCGVSTGVIAGNGADDLYEITGTITNGATAGPVKLQWAQNTLTASNTIVRAGSYVNATRAAGGSGSSTAFVQDGNTQGIDAVLGTNDNFALNFETNGITNLTLGTNGDLNIVNGALLTAGVTRISNSGALQNVTADTSILTSGTLSIARGGTGATSFTTNGIVFGNGTSLSSTAAGTGGQLLLAGAGGIPSFVSLSGDATLSNTGVLTIANGAITNAKLQNSSFTLAYGTNLSGDASVALGGTLNLAISATPSFTTLSTTGAITAGNGLTVTTGGASVNGGLNLNSSAISGVTTLGLSGAITGATTGNTINGLIINSGALSGVTGLTFSSGNLNLNGGNILSAGTISAAGSKFNVNANGDQTTAFTATGQATTTNGSSGLGTSTSLVVTNATGFVTGNYVQIVDAGGCSGAVTTCYAKVTAIAGNTLTITPALKWTTAKAVTEYHVPEIGGTDTAQTLTNRYGRGYFIAGVATGNGTTYYNEDGIESNLSTFNLLNSTVATLNIGGAATTLNIGNSGTNVSILGNLSTAASQTITAGGGLVVSSGGINNNNGGIINTGSLAGVTSISASGSVTAATTNTINGLSINSGSLSDITGFSQTSGAFSVTGTGAITLGGGSNPFSIDSTAFDVSSSGDLSGIGTINATGLATITGGATISGGTISLNVGGALRNTRINTGASTGTVTIGGGSAVLVIDSTAFDVSSTGDLSGIGTLSMSGGITAATSGTINGLSISAGALSSISTINMSGAITAATTVNTINGLIINSGSLSGITGFSQTSGTHSVTGTGAITLGGGSNALTIDSTAFDVSSTGAVSGVTTLGLSGAITGATSTNTINGLVINSGALSSITTISMSGGITAATSGTINGLSINAGTLTGVTGITFSSGNLALGGGNITGVGTNITGNGALTITSAAATALTLDSGTTGNVNLGTSNNAKTLNIATGTAGDTINLATDNTVTDVLNIGSANDTLTITSSAFKVTSAGAVSGLTTLSLSGAITGATATNTINGLIINAGSLSGVTGFAQSSGNFAISGTGTFSTGTGAISLNGATTASSTLNVTGLTTLSGNLTIQTGDTFTFNGEGFTDLTGNGLVLSGSTLAVDVATAGTVAGTGSNSGLVVAADGVSLLRGCANNQILKWSTTGPQWNCAADNTGISDARLKKNIESVNMSVLSRIRNVNLYSFDFDCTNPAFQTMHCDTDHQNAGVIAQELMQQFPELVMEVNGHYEVRYNELGLYNLKAVGELADAVDALSANTNTELNQVVTNGVLRMDSNGVLQNINGLTMTSGSASIVGGLNNNNGGITSVGSLSGVTGISAQSVSLNADASTDMLHLTKDGNNVFTVFNSGALQLQLDSPQALAIKAANGDNALSVDTLTGKIRIGAGNNGKTFLFVLDSKSTAGDPDGAVNGAQYYNADSNKFRCYQNNEWQDCVQTAYSEYSVMSTPGPWVQPSGEMEFPVQNRTWIEFRNANQFRILANLMAAGAANATCRMQYATGTDTNNLEWHNLSSAGDGGPIHLNGTGALKSDWTPVIKEAKKENLVRVYCAGGDMQTAPNFTSIRIQVR